jgi:transcriptional regulator with XRE-family HTH domain
MMTTQARDIEQQKKVIASNLKAARKLAKLKMDDVSDLLYGKGKNAKNRLSEYENAVCVPNLATLISLAQIYDVSLDYLVGLSSEPEHDADSAHAARIMASLKMSGNRMMESIARMMALQVRKAPKGCTVALVEQARVVQRFANNVINHTDFMKTTPGSANLAKAVAELGKIAGSVEDEMDRQSRVMERAVQDIAIHDEGVNGHLFAWAAPDEDEEAQMSLGLKAGN